MASRTQGVGDRRPDGARGTDDENPHAAEAFENSPGEQPARPLVLLHGFTGSSHSWGRRLVDELRRGGREVVALDLPGHGPEPSAAGREAILESVTDQVSSVVDGTFDLLGYSMGGRLALHVAHRFPDRVARLILESASPGLATDEERAARRASDAAWAERLRTHGMEAFAAAWADVPVLRPGPRRSRWDHERAQRVRRSHDPVALAAALEGLGTGALPSLWEELSSISAPTLLLVGRLDVKFVEIARRMCAALPRSRTVLVPEAGHTIHLDRPGAWASEVRAFLDAV